MNPGYRVPEGNERLTEQTDVVFGRASVGILAAKRAFQGAEKRRLPDAPKGDSS